MVSVAEFRRTMSTSDRQQRADAAAEIVLRLQALMGQNDDHSDGGSDLGDSYEEDDGSESIEDLNQPNENGNA